MKVSITLLFAAAAAVMAQDTVVATASCEPHGDHWHCPSGVPEPTAPPAASASHDDDAAHSHDTVSATASGVCEPHGDHWHCPSGVPEPTIAPGTAAVTPAPAATASHSDHDDDDDHAATASTCEPHGDHWHCPSGVAEPSTAPAASAGPSSTTPAASSASAPAQQTANAAAAVGGNGQGVVLAMMCAAAYML